MGSRQIDDSGRRKTVEVIGVTGGVGAGKSRILQLLEEEYGARILLADQVAAQLEEPGYPGFKLLVERFGSRILGEDGRLDRKAFAEMIFKSRTVLEEVNEMIHPLTWQALLGQVEDIRSRYGETKEAAAGLTLLVAVEAALFDEKSRQLCDTLWYVDTSEENRIGRLMENRGYSREKCRDIMENQPDRQRFLELADQVIDNNGTMEQVREQLEKLLGPPRITGNLHAPQAKSNK